jgi:50S ribosomal protein L16 3-hydroxylase
MSPAEFEKRHYQKLPLPHRGGAESLAKLGSFETLAAILASRASGDEGHGPAKVPAKVMVARSGEALRGDPPRDIEAARALHAEGWTISVQHAERHHEGLGALARDFEAALGAPVDVHLYLTPAEGHGFGWHYDVEDVFLVQTEGRKDYFFRKNTVNPWPHLDAMPRDLAVERESMPVLTTTLLAGDWLYLPAGYWHVAKAGAASASLAIGLLSATGLHALDRLRGSLLRSLLWRARLPVTGGAAGLDEDALAAEYRAAFRELAKDFERSLLDERFIRSWVEKTPKI